MFKKVMELKKDKLSSKLVKRILMIGFVAVLYIMVINFNFIKGLEEDRVADVSDVLMASYSKESANMVNKTFDVAELLSMQIEYAQESGRLTLSEMKNVIEPALENMEECNGIYILYKKNGFTMNPYWYRDGDKIVMDKIEESDSDKYWSIVEDTDRGLLQPQYHHVGNRYLFLTTLEVPIKKNGELVGVLGIDLSLDYFQNMIEQLEPIKEMEISIVSDEGVVIAHCHPEAIGNRFDQKTLESYFNVIGDKYVIQTPFYMGGADSEWTLVVSVPKNTLIRNAKIISLNIFVVGFTVIIVMSIFVSFMVRKTLSPIQSLTEVMEIASNGDLSVRTKIDSNDEIENIGDKLNELLESLEKHRKMLTAELESNDCLNRELESLMQENDRVYFETIKSLTRTIDAKDPYTGGHCDRVTDFSLAIGNRLGLGSNDILSLTYGAILHDIGKIGIPGKILCKEGPLTDEEFDMIKAHPAKGLDILKDIQFLSRANVCVHQHHERYDGRGYPQGLQGENIDILGRIISVADAYDAMTSSRSYRKALDKDVAVTELIKNRGTQFDPEIVDVFLEVLEQNELSVEKTS